MKPYSMLNTFHGILNLTLSFIPIVWALVFHSIGFYSFRSILRNKYTLYCTCAAAAADAAVCVLINEPINLAQICDSIHNKNNNITKKCQRIANFCSKHPMELCAFKCQTKQIKEKRIVAVAIKMSMTISQAKLYGMRAT